MQIFWFQGQQILQNFLRRSRSWSGSPLPPTVNIEYSPKRWKGWKKYKWRRKYLRKENSSPILGTKINYSLFFTNSLSSYANKIICHRIWNRPMKLVSQSQLSVIKNHEISIRYKINKSKWFLILKFSQTHSVLIIWDKM